MRDVSGMRQALQKNTPVTNPEKLNTRQWSAIRANIWGCARNRNQMQDCNVPKPAGLPKFDFVTQTS